MARFAIAEVAKIGILKATDVEDSHVVRVPKTYPAYFGSYDRFDVIRRYLDGFPNLFLVGHNSMHKYNNQDHSMVSIQATTRLTALGVSGEVSSPFWRRRRLGLARRGIGWSGWQVREGRRQDIFVWGY